MWLWIQRVVLMCKQKRAAEWIRVWQPAQDTSWVSLMRCTQSFFHKCFNDLPRKPDRWEERYNRDSRRMWSSSRQRCILSSFPKARPSLATTRHWPSQPLTAPAPKFGATFFFQNKLPQPLPISRIWLAALRTREHLKIWKTKTKTNITWRENSKIMYKKSRFR